MRMQCCWLLAFQTMQCLHVDMTVSVIVLLPLQTRAGAMPVSARASSITIGAKEPRALRCASAPDPSSVAYQTNLLP
jgi:hypothetical protein